MKYVEQSFFFNPELRLFDTGDQISVIFDSQCPIDSARAACWLNLPRGFKRLSFAVEGFDEPVDDGARRELAGEIFLTYSLSGAEGADKKESVAKCQLVFNSAGKPDKQGAFIHIDEKRVQYAVRQAVSSALTEALADYFDGRSGVEMGVAPGASQELVANPDAGRPARRLSRRESQQASATAAAQAIRSRKIKTYIAWFAPPVLIVLVLGGLQLLASKQSPIENAVAQQMANDPESIKQQVDLVNQTLKSMNIDPGKGGDLGCLAPQ